VISREVIDLSDSVIKYLVKPQSDKQALDIQSLLLLFYYHTETC